MIRALVFALVATFAISSTALAGGGGGTKKDATVKINNDLPNVVAVIINPTAADITAIQTPALAGDLAAALTQLKNRGGISVDPGKSGNIKVKSGNQNIQFWVIDGTPAVVDAGTVTRSVGKGKTLTINASAL
jgi:hypothetical protein